MASKLMASEPCDSRYKSYRAEIASWSTDLAFHFTRMQNHMNFHWTVWPLWRVEQLLSKHLDYDARKGLGWFLLDNKCCPLLMTTFMRARGMLKDMEARNHMASVIADHKSGKAALYTTDKMGRTSSMYETDERAGQWLECTLPRWDKCRWDKNWQTDVMLKAASYGNPLDHEHPNYSCKGKIDVPSIEFLKAEGWRWDRAVAMLKDTTTSFLPSANFVLPSFIEVPVDWGCDDTAAMLIEDPDERCATHKVTCTGIIPRQKKQKTSGDENTARN